MQISKAQKDSQVTIVFFALLGTAHKNPARKALVKLTPVRYEINGED